MTPILTNGRKQTESLPSSLYRPEKHTWPKADVYVGQTLAFRAAPVQALMAWSPQANAHFRAEHLSRKVVLSEVLNMSILISPGPGELV